MTQRPDSNSDGDERLRAALGSAAPKPSATHNETVMMAARAKAAARGRTRNASWALTPGLGIAATTVLAIAIVWLLRVEEPGIGLERGGVTEGIVPADGAVLDATPARFEWPAAANGSYQLNIYNDSAILLWQSETLAEPALVVSDELALEGGARYFWVVERQDSGGTAPPMGPYWFSIR